MEQKRTRRVLIVDDHIDGAESLASLLRLLGHDVRTAASGYEALTVAEQFRPTIVFLDIGMPGMNGFETCRKMREREWAQDATIYALTAWDQDQDFKDSEQAGFDAHLVKPLNPAVLPRLLSY